MRIKFLLDIIIGFIFFKIKILKSKGVIVWLKLSDSLFFNFFQKKFISKKNYFIH